MPKEIKLFRELPTLETERLILRKIFLSDCNDIFEYASNNEVTKYLSWPTHKSLEDTQEFIYQITQSYIDAQPSSWGIELKSESKIIGTIGFLYWDIENKRTEVGFVLSKDYWRKGLMTEALIEIVKFAFLMMDVNRIEARTLLDNIASQSLLEKNNFLYEGILREYIYFNNKFLDVKLFSLLRNQF